MTFRSHILHIIVGTAILMTAVSCGIYSFSGTSIQPDVTSITIDFAEYKALKANPMLSTQFTEAMKEKFRKLTKLEQLDMDGDLLLHTEITGYDVSATSVTAEEVAARNRLTVSVKAQFTNRKYPEDDFDKSFSAYADFDATQLLDAVQDALCEEIIEKLVDDIFNASVAQW